MKWWLVLIVISATLACLIAARWPTPSSINWVAGEATLVGISCACAALLVFDRILPEAAT